MARRLPPAPKERPASLAVSAPPRLAPDAAGPSVRRGETVALFVFIGLILLGLVAAGRALLVM